jgi:RHS repeat-associated protein
MIAGHRHFLALTSNRYGDVSVATLDVVGTTSTVSYVTADHLGTSRAVNNSAGAQIWSWPYVGNPFGEIAPTSTMGYVLNLRYPGQYFDAESGLSHNDSRDYDSTLDRYIQSDFIGLKGGVSTYAYANNSPLMLVDPLGQASPVCHAVLTGIGAVCGAYIGGSWGGALGGGAGALGGTTVEPGGGTLLGGGTGYVIGTGTGTILGGAAGYAAGNYAASSMCDDDDDLPTKCEKQLEREETLCQLIAGPRYPGNPEQAVRICKTAAFKRYSMCLRGVPEIELPPLTGVDTEI